MILPNTSLKKTLLVIIFLSVTLSALFSSLAITFNFYIDYKKSIRENVQKVGLKLKADIEKVVSLGLSVQDLPNFEKEIGDKVAFEKTLLYIVIADKAEKVDISSTAVYKGKQFPSKDDQTVSFNGESAINIVVPVMSSANEVVYFINLGLKKSLLDEKLFYTFLLVIIVTAVSVIVLFGIAKVIIEKRLIVPLTRLEEGTTRVAEGDLGITVEHGNNDEVGKVTKNFNMMVKEIREIVDGITEGLRHLTGISSVAGELSGSVKTGSSKQLESVNAVLKVFKNIEERVEMLKSKINTLNDFLQLTTSTFHEISATSEEVFRTMEELMQSVAKVDDASNRMNGINRKLSEGSATLSRETENILSFVSEMDSSVKTTLSNVQETSSISERMEMLARDSKKTLQDSINGIENIAQVSVAARNSFDTLRQNVSKITNILDMISEVTEQTNMLALNAAIIAAQNDETGKAFSIVADEIKNLSRRTKASTKEIAELITVITEQTEEVFEKVHESARDSEVAVRQSKDTEAKIGEIISLIGSAAHGVKSILHAANEQFIGSSTVRKEAEELQGISETLASVQEESSKAGRSLGEIVTFISDVGTRVSTSIREQNLSISNLNKSISDLGTFSQELAEHIDRETVEFNLARPVMMEINKLAQDNSFKASDLESGLSDLRDQITRFNELIKRFKKD